jgi:hypothetical protein
MALSDREELNPLQNAAKNGDIPNIVYRLSKGDPFAVDEVVAEFKDFKCTHPFAAQQAQCTALYLAAERGHILAALVLLAFGADKGKAIALAKQFEQADVEAALNKLHKDPDITYAILAGYGCQFPGLVKQLLGVSELRIEVEGKGEKKDSKPDPREIAGLLELAAYDKNIFFTRALLAVGRPRFEVEIKSTSAWAYHSENPDLIATLCCNDQERAFALYQLSHSEEESIANTYASHIRRQAAGVRQVHQELVAKYDCKEDALPPSIKSETSIMRAWEKRDYVSLMRLIGGGNHLAELTVALTAQNQSLTRFIVISCKQSLYSLASNLKNNSALFKALIDDCWRLEAWLYMRQYYILFEFNTSDNFLKNVADAELRIKAELNLGVELRAVLRARRRKENLAKESKEKATEQEHEPENENAAEESKSAKIKKFDDKKNDAAPLQLESDVFINSLLFCLHDHDLLFKQNKKFNRFLLQRGKGLGRFSTFLDQFNLEAVLLRYNLVVKLVTDYKKESKITDNPLFTPDILNSTFPYLNPIDLACVSGTCKVFSHTANPYKFQHGLFKSKYIESKSRFQKLNHDIQRLDVFLNAVAEAKTQKSCWNNRVHVDGLRLILLLILLASTMGVIDSLRLMCSLPPSTSIVFEPIVNRVIGELFGGLAGWFLSLFLAIIAQNKPGPFLPIHIDMRGPERFDELLLSAFPRLSHSTLPPDIRSEIKPGMTLGAVHAIIVAKKAEWEGEIKILKGSFFQIKPSNNLPSEKDEADSKYQFNVYTHRTSRCDF